MYGSMRATRPASSFRTWLVARRPRLRLVAFFVRMWLLNAWPHLNLPDAVLRNRFAAARLVFILGMTQLLRWFSILARAVGEPTLSVLLVPACRARIADRLLLCSSPFPRRRWRGACHAARLG